MNLVISASINRKLDEVKGLNLATLKVLKVKSHVEIKLDEKTNSGVLSLLAKDVKLLKIEGEPLHNVTVMVEGASALGKVFNRSIPAFGKVGVGIGEIGWDDSAGLVEVGAVLPLVGSDLPSLAEALVRLVNRAMSSISGTHHPFTLFDLQQAMGLVYDAKQLDAMAQSTLDWMSVRELTILEGIKDAKAKAKAAEKSAKAKEKDVAVVKAAETKAKAPVAKVGTEKNVPAEKAKPKPIKAIRTATLIPS